MKNRFTLNGPRGKLLQLGEPHQRLIQELDVCQFNNRAATSMDKSIMIDGTVFGFRAPNRIFSDGKPDKKIWAGSPTARKIFDAALAFGIIGKPVRDEINKAVAKDDELAETRKAISDLNIALSQVGIKLTPAQQKAVKAFEARNGGRDTMKGWD